MQSEYAVEDAYMTYSFKCKLCEALLVNLYYTCNGARLLGFLAERALRGANLVLQGASLRNTLNSSTFAPGVSSTKRSPTK